jgi:hypothetical protein
MYGCERIDWVNAKRCRKHAARHYLRILSRHQITFRVTMSGDHSQIDVPRHDLQLCEELWSEQQQVPAIEERRRVFSAPFNCLLGIVVGAVTGALIGEWARSSVSPHLSAIFAVAGCVVGLACEARGQPSPPQWR